MSPLVASRRADRHSIILPTAPIDEGVRDHKWCASRPNGGSASCEDVDTVCALTPRTSSAPSLRSPHRVVRTRTVRITLPRVIVLWVQVPPVGPQKGGGGRCRNPRPLGQGECCCSLPACQPRGTPRFAAAAEPPLRQYHSPICTWEWALLTHGGPVWCCHAQVCAALADVCTAAAPFMLKQRRQVNHNSMTRSLGAFLQTCGLSCKRVLATPRGGVLGVCG